MQHRSKLYRGKRLFLIGVLVLFFMAISSSVLLAQIGPTFTSAASATAVVGSEYSYELEASGDTPITFSFTTTTFTPPTGMSMDGSGVISWTPTIAQTGIHTIEVQADNAHGMDTQQFGVLVNAPPIFTSNAASAAVVGSEYSYELEASGDTPITFSFTTTTHTPPTGMSMDGSGVISWTPTITQTGIHTIEVQADNAYGMDTQQFEVLVNAPPTFTSNAAETAVVDIEYSYELEASGDTPITFSFTTTTHTPPTGMSMDGSGVISWTPTITQTGIHTIEVQADNAYGMDTQQFEVLVNASPIFTSNAPAAAIVGTEYNYQLEASGDMPLTFSFTTTTYIQPTGMSMNGSGLISWTPTIAQTGIHTIEVQADNAYGLDTQQFSVEVGSTPNISTTAVTTAIVGQLYQYDVDAEGVPSPTFSLIIMPSGMTMDSNSGVISWIPTSVQTGLKSVQVRATNDAGVDNESFDINVRQIPEVTSVPNNTTITAGQSFNGSATASGVPDPDFSLVNNTPGWLSIHPDSGLITGNSTQANAGVNVVTVQAENSVGSDTDFFNITVESTAVCLYDPLSYLPLDEVTSNTSPDMIWSNNGTCSGSTCPSEVSTPNGDALDFDGNNDGLEVSTPTNMDWDTSDSFTIQVWVNSSQTCTNNKVIAGTFSNQIPEGFWWLGCGKTNNETVLYLQEAGLGGAATPLHGVQAINDGLWHQITAVRDAPAKQIRLYVDGVLDASMALDASNTFANNSPLYIGYYGTFHAGNHYFDGLIDELVIYNRVLTVPEIEQHYYYTQEGVGYCAETAVAPQITSTAGLQGAVNNFYTYDVNATGIPIPTYSLVVTPTGMTINSTTGIISWIPTVDQVGQHAVEVQASNSGGNNNQSFNIDVVLHSAPTITSTAPITAVVDSLYTYQLAASGDTPITYNFTTTTHTLPTGMSMNGSGLISWTPTITQTGIHTIVVQADNAYGLGTQEFIVRVSDGPTITSIAPITAVVGLPYNYQLAASGDTPITYNFTTTTHTPPDGMSINGSGLISWTATITQTGVHTIEVQANNAYGLDVQQFSVLVNDGPVITSLPVTEVFVGTTYIYDVDAIGDPAPQFSFANTPPTGMTIDSNTGMIAWDVPTTYPEGLVNIIVKATNLAGNDTQTFDIEVKKYTIYLPTILK